MKMKKAERPCMPPQQRKGKIVEHEMKVNILTGIRKGGPYTWGRDLAAELDRHGMEAKHIHTLGALLYSPIYQDADVIHTSLPLSHRLWKKPVVLTIHGEYPPEKNIWRFFYPAAIKRADIVTTPSNFLKERLNLDKAIVIPNAIFPQRFGMAEHTGKDIINLVTATKFYFQDKARGVLNILEILSNVPEEVRKHIKYTVVGGGPYLEQVTREKKRYNIDVEFTGALQSPQEILEHSDLFLYYSHQDNFPIAILEAMACGLPVITNEVGAVSEIIENEKDGYIAATDNTYLEYLLNLINNSNLRAKVGENARKTAETRFNWEKIVSRYVEIYNKLI